MRNSQRLFPREGQIHEMRVAVKRLRAILRLVECAGESITPSLHHDLKKISDRLSPSRDETVCSEWLKDHALKAPATPSQEKISLVALGRALARDQKKVERLAHLRLTSVPLQERALKISVRRMRKARRKALQRGSDQAHHQWRKRVKDLQYQLEFLKIPRFRSRLRKLGQYLGQAHDCELVAQYVASRRLECRHQAKGTANREKKKLQKRAAKIRIPKRIRDARALPY